MEFDFDADYDQERFLELKEDLDDLCEDICTQAISCEEARKQAEELRLEAALAFPDKLELYDMIYSSRVERLIQQFLE